MANSPLTPYTPKVPQEPDGQEEQSLSQRTGQDIKNTANKAKNAGQKISDKFKNLFSKGKKAGNGATQKTKQLANMAKKVAKAVKALAKLILKGLKLLAKMIKWLATLIGPWGIIIAIIVVVIAAICAVVVAMVVQTYGGGYDADSQTMTSYHGIAGDSFYGGRAFYYDNQESSKMLSESYTDFTTQILYDMKYYGISIAFESESNIEKGNTINKATLDYANILASTSGTDLLTATKSIDHFGFRETGDRNEKDIVLKSLASTIKNKYSQDYSKVLEALEDAYEDNFGYMKKVCSKILVKDYLLNSEDERFTLEKKHYISFIYMPKQEVTINSLTYAYKVDGTQKLNSKLIYTKNSDSKTLVESNIDSSWYDGVANETQEYIIPITLGAFTEIGAKANTFKTPISIFELRTNDEYSELFNGVDDNIEIDRTNIPETITSSERLMLEFDTDASFNFIDILAQY